MSFIWKHFCFSTSFLLVSVWGNYSGITIIENEDHYSIVKVEGGKYEDFGNVDCSQQLFEQGYYDDGTACKNVNIKLVVRYVPTRDLVPEIIDSNPMYITDLFQNK